jgi:type I restriction enzyme, R subunit
LPARSEPLPWQDDAWQARLREGLSFSHLLELSRVQAPLARAFYEVQALAQRWSVRELKRQRESMLFERVGLSRDKDAVLALAEQGRLLDTPATIVRDPYVLEFLGLPEREAFLEADGSGKSNTIAWLTHRLASLHDEGNRRVFDSVIVVTDRVVLDQQLQDNIYQFEHKRGVVQKIDESSRQLAEALESAVPIIITTLQKFPFVSRQLLKMAEERGEAGVGTLQTRRCAVVIDEAHSSQGGETATDLKEVLGGEALRQEAQKRAAEEGREELEELFRSMAKRGRQANLSFFAFTATPKHRTLAVFGRSGKAAHRYTMRQAIEEGFILDVLKSYTTYATYFRLLKSCEDDPNVERKKAARALARFLKLHPHHIAQKTEVMVEHFHAVTRHRIGGRAKAMVVTGSRLEAVRYKQSFDRHIKD